MRTALYAICVVVMLACFVALMVINHKLEARVAYLEDREPIGVMVVPNPHCAAPEPTDEPGAPTL